MKINGNIESDPGIIEENVVKFFHSLFNGHHDASLNDTGTPFVPDNSGLDNFLNGLDSLPNDLKEEMEAKIELDELSEVVMKSHNNRSPGLDGLTYEFYKQTWDLIQYDFIQVLQCQLDRKRIVDSNAKGVTRLCPKVSEVPAVDELRLITLLNSDYKLLSKWLVKRIRPKLPLVIRSGQLCTVERKKHTFWSI